MQDALLLVSLPPASPCQQLPIGAHLNLLLFPTTSFPIPHLPLSLCQNKGWHLTPVREQALNKQLLLILIWLVFIYLHRNLIF